MSTKANHERTGKVLAHARSLLLIAHGILDFYEITKLAAHSLCHVWIENVRNIVKMAVGV
jgi:hypothetical protein